eukprot:s2429_g15.t1
MLTWTALGLSGLEAYQIFEVFAHAKLVIASRVIGDFHVFSSSLCLPGGVLYDGIQIKMPDKSLEDFRAFLSAENALQANSNLQNAVESGPARHKISTAHASFASCAKTRDWTTADERSLALSFWMGTEFALHKDEFLGTLPEQMSQIDVSNFFCERYSAVKPEADAGLDRLRDDMTVTHAQGPAAKAAATAAATVESTAKGQTTLLEDDDGDGDDDQGSLASELLEADGGDLASGSLDYENGGGSPVRDGRARSGARARGRGPGRGRGNRGRGRAASAVAKEMTEAAGRPKRPQSVPMYRQSAS